MSENNLLPDNIKTKPGIRHLRAIGLVLCKQIQLSRDAAKKGASLKAAASVKFNEDSAFMKKVKNVWDGKV